MEVLQGELSRVGEDIPPSVWFSRDFDRDAGRYIPHDMMAKWWNDTDPEKSGRADDCEWVAGNTH